MFSFRRLALVLAVAFSAGHVAFSQSSSSSSNPPASQQDQAQPPATEQNQGALTVQARIRARRAQRRAQAVRDVYSHRYELDTGMGYLRFKSGPNVQRVTMYAYDAGVTRYFTQRLGVSLDGRGYFGSPFVGLNFVNITRPAISVFTVLGGPSYRFYMQPRYSISGRVMGGWAQGNFSGDTNHVGGQYLGLYPDGNTYAGSASVIGEVNLSPGLGLRLAPEYFVTGFGSTTQQSLGFTGGLVVRFGKQ